jgi:hydrogenase expression/formation protein HypD
LEAGAAKVENQYSRVLNRDGNLPARKLVDSVFEVCNRKWRGVGNIADSGYRLNPDYRDYDAEHIFEVTEIDTKESAICISGQILRGIKKPHDCTAFGTMCTPLTPLGATMVSAEGACAAYYAYGRHLDKQKAESAAPVAVGGLA